MVFRKIIITAIVVAIPLSALFLTIKIFVSASSSEEPYSIYIVAGQSWAEGTNSYRASLPAGTGLDKQDHPADTTTGFWWAGADGAGPRDTFEFLNMFFNGVSPAGWVQSGGHAATGAQRLKNLNNPQRGNIFGPELGVGRELYDKGRRKVVILKVSYGFQSLAKSNSSMIPYDFNVEPGRNRGYQRIKTEFAALTNYIKSQGQTYTVDGLFWLQGGTDALQQSYATQYQQNFQDFVNAARTDFQMHPASHLVAVKMSMQACLQSSYPLVGDYCGFPYAASVDPLVVANLDTAQPNLARRTKTVREALQTVADADQADRVKVDVVEVNDIPMARDQIHYSELGNIEVGRRMVNMYRMPYRLEGSSDYDNDGILNSQEDTGTSCTIGGDGGPTANNGNLGDDDCDNDGYPNYLDRINGVGNGI